MKQQPNSNERGENSKKSSSSKAAGILLLCNTVIMTVLGIYFFVMPFFMMIYFISDPALKGAGPNKFAMWLHRRLSPRYEKWARDRVSSGRAEKLYYKNIPGTEWPMFGSVFYLLSTEYIEEGLKDGNDASSVLPSKYAAGAIEAATSLVVDQGNAAWVKQYWGENYLHRENVFYRMLLISGTTSYQKLLGGGEYLGLLRDQVKSLSAEIDASDFGLLDDYPGQCFPTDVIAALAAIKRADAVLGTDHSAFLKRSLRGFEKNLIDPITGLPPYMADKTCACPGEARGCSSQWGIRWAAQLWPDTAKQWYDDFDKYFWQWRFGMAGFREYNKGSDFPNWHFDVDSGPVVGGFGAAASAFGLGAARANGRIDHAYPLAAEAIVLSWPLPDGTLLLPRLLSNASDAPYIGGCSVLFNMSQPAEQGFEITKASDLPGIIYWVLPLHLLLPLVLIASSVGKLKWWWKNRKNAMLPHVDLQVLLWIALFGVGVMFLFYDRIFHGLVFILLSQLLPRGIKAAKGNVTGKQPQIEST
jgi:hypothetical protein